MRSLSRTIVLAKLFVSLGTLVLAGCGGQDAEPAITYELGSTSQALGRKFKFGTSTTDAFENAWQEPLPHAWSYMNAFSNSISHHSASYDVSLAWSRQLGDGSWMREPKLSDPDGMGADGVNFLYVLTHGAAGVYKEPDGHGGYVDGQHPVLDFSRNPKGDPTAELSMQAKDAFVSSTQLRFGECGPTGLEVLALDACNALRNDADSGNRWFHAFGGGLKMLLGHASLFYLSEKTWGSRLAYDLVVNNEPIARAWEENRWAANHKHSVVAMATGVNEQDCYDRLYHMTIANLKDYPSIHESSIGVMCQVTTSSK